MMRTITRSRFQITEIIRNWSLHVSVQNNPEAYYFEQTFEHAIYPPCMICMMHVPSMSYLLLLYASQASGFASFSLTLSALERFASALPIVWSWITTFQLSESLHIILLAINMLVSSTRAYLWGRQPTIHSSQSLYLSALSISKLLNSMLHINISFYSSNLYLCDDLHFLLIATECTAFNMAARPRSSLSHIYRISILAPAP